MESRKGGINAMKNTYEHVIGIIEGKECNL